MLKCNLSKTEIINFSSRFSPAEPIGSNKVGDHYVQPTSVVKDLGVTLDSHLTFVPPVNNTCVALFHVRFILLAESENIFSKRMLSALSMPSFIEIGLLLVIVCTMEFPLVKLRTFRDCRIPRQD